MEGPSQGFPPEPGGGPEERRNDMHGQGRRIRLAFWSFLSFLAAVGLLAAGTAWAGQAFAYLLLTGNGPSARGVLMDPARLSVLAYVPALTNETGGTHGITITPDGKSIYAGHAFKPWVEKIDIITQRSLKRITWDGKASCGLKISPDGKSLYVGGRVDPFVVKIDLATDKVVGKIRLEKQAHKMNFSPDGKWLYVAGGTSDKIHVVDVARGKAVKAIPVGKVPHGALPTPDGKKLYVTVRGENVLKVVDLKTDKVVETIKVPVVGTKKGLCGLNASPDWRILYVGETFAATIHVMDLKSRKFVDRIDVGGFEVHEPQVHRLVR